MNKPTLKEVLIALCARDPRIPKWPDGTVHHTKAAEMIGMNQATLSRMLSGQSQHPKAKNSDPLCEFFEISYDQLVGDAEIEGLFPDGKYQFPRVLKGTGMMHIGLSADMEYTPAAAEDAGVYKALTDKKQQAAVKAIADSVSPADAITIAEYFLARAKAGLRGK